MNAPASPGRRYGLLYQRDLDPKLVAQLGEALPGFWALVHVPSQD